MPHTSPLCSRALLAAFTVCATLCGYTAVAFAEAVPPLDESECCSDPGQVANCWWADAYNDGVSCYEDSDCLSGSCDEEAGLCNCANNVDCYDGVSSFGVCREDGLCGPSYCNGYLVCSCWGGCQQANKAGPYASPQEMCGDSEAGYPGFCCEGTYPQGPEGSPQGYCSDSPFCGAECMGGGDCDDDNPCTVDTCAGGRCYNEPLDGQAPMGGTCPLDDTQSADCALGWCSKGECSPLPAGEGRSCSDNPQGKDASWYGDDPRATEGDASSCYFQKCDSSGRCLASAADANNLPCASDDNNVCTDSICSEGRCTFVPGAGVAGRACNADNNACTLDACSDSGKCKLGPRKSCDDSNWCTSPDTCVDNDPKHVLPSCLNPPVSGPATDFGYKDTTDCQDIECVNGFEKITRPSCGSHNPEGLDLQCNSYSCKEGSGEDNCSLEYASFLGKACSTGDPCSTGAKCVDGGRFGVCQSTSQINCDDSNACTRDSCQAGVCLHEPLTGTSCDDSNGCTQNDSCNAGACVPGTPITAKQCASTLGLDTDCNTAQCVSTGNKSFTCQAVPIATNPGECNADNNGCTLDRCENTGNPKVGAVCTVGTSRNCSSLNNPPCRTGYCDDFGNDYNSSCQFQNSPVTQSCNKDSNGCTFNDHCDGQGKCVSGRTDVCSSSDSCHTSKCKSTGVNSYLCKETLEHPLCCEDVSDCFGKGLPCEGAPAPPVGCSALACKNKRCVCNAGSEGSKCSDYYEGENPPNCYDGFCDDAGGCVGTMHFASNNLCSDLFAPGNQYKLDKNAESYLGAFTVDQGDGTKLFATGSTVCANNNYYSTGRDCREKSTGNWIGQQGPDVVYAFEYQTNKVDQYEMFAYEIKVEADYDVGIYIKKDITRASHCPEGNQPGNDGVRTAVSSSSCSFPYQNRPMPPVLEDVCTNDGNKKDGSQCCDPCTQGIRCGYHWCKRGYNYDNSPCNICKNAGKAGYDYWTHKGDCDAIWIYPPDPYSCTSETPPNDPGYSDYDYMASSIVYPKGNNSSGGSWEKVFIFIDGVSAKKGNFHVSVEKKKWYAGPCDRANDDARTVEVTNVGSSGEYFIGTLEDVVNHWQVPAGNHDPSCAGILCGDYPPGSTTVEWRNIGCHENKPANQFWPNFQDFRIEPQIDSWYCIKTVENIPDSADLTINAFQRVDSNALPACNTSYYNMGCAHNNISKRDAGFEFKAKAGQKYRISISMYNWMNRPCGSRANDDCKFKVHIKQGRCK